jgi:hypothetical protein
MSAWGQTQKCAGGTRMSALLPKADISGDWRYLGEWLFQA